MSTPHSTRVARHRVNPGRPRAPRFDIEHLKATVDLEDLVRSMSDGEGPPSGGNSWFRCPLPHHEDRDPSFSVQKGGQHWRCWSCGVNGSGPIDLVMAVHGLDFGPAVRWLGERYGGREATDTLSTINRKAPPRPPEPTDPANLDRRTEFKRAKRLPFGRGTQFRSQLVNGRKWNDGPPDRFSRIEQFRIELVELVKCGMHGLIQRWRCTRRRTASAVRTRLPHRSRLTVQGATQEGCGLHTARSLSLLSCAVGRCACRSSRIP